MNRRVAGAAAGAILVTCGLVLARPHPGASEALGANPSPAQATSSAPVASAEPTVSASTTPRDRTTPQPSSTPALDPGPTPSASVKPPSSAAGAALRAVTIGLSVPLSSVSASGSVLNPPSWGAAYVRGLDRVAPGHVGTSVIIGHVVVGGRAGVFADLTGLRNGDAIVVADASGVRRTLRVVASSVEAKTAVQNDPRVWGPNSTVRRVVLVTCDSALGFRADGHRVANFYVVAEAVA